MPPNLERKSIILKGKEFRREVILDDVNIPYKFSIDRDKNTMFFSINADQFSDQSFQMVVMDLDTNRASIVPSIRNGYASTVDHDSGTVYLGGSNGVFKYSYVTGDIMKPPLVDGVDIFDLFYKNKLYFVDTAGQNLYICNGSKATIMPEVKDHLIRYFVVDGKEDIVFLNSVGVFALPKGHGTPVLYDNRAINMRGATTDVEGKPHFVAQDGLYTINEDTRLLERILQMDNGYGLAFDRDNNIIYSDERSVAKLLPR